MTVLVSMPYWRTPGTVRRAVDSVLAGTYDDVVVVVVNDGDRDTPPWPHLADIDDPRLIRFDLEQNRGRYWCDAVTLAANPYDWWSPHDSDDESVPHRFDTLHRHVDGADVVFSDCVYHNLDGTVTYDAVRRRLLPVKWRRLRTIARYPAGMWRTEAARYVGGPHPDVRGSYDTMMVCLTFLAFTPTLVADGLYRVHKRSGSLTTAADTTVHGPSTWRSDQRRTVRQLLYRLDRNGDDEWAARLQPDEPTRSAVAADAARLRTLIQEAHPCRG